MKVKISSEEKTHTEKPLEELWLQLRLFESEYYSRQFLKEKYPDITNEELDKLSVIFASNIKQAYEYYSAASSVSILTSPLLYYYGMMCLTNVLWASLNKTNDISEDHGLYSNSDSSDHLLSNEYVIVHKEGSFPALHSCFSDIPITNGTKFYIKDILSVIPELKTLFEKIFDEKSRCIKFTRKDHYFSYNHRELLRFQDVLENNESFFKQYNVPLYTLFTGRPEKTIEILYSINDEMIFEYPFQKNLNGEIFFTFPINFEDTVYAVPEASAHFMVMHCLGMLVRYEPVKWLQIVSGKLSSDINLINRFIEVSKRKFPNMILNDCLVKNYNSL
jgi:hypothetical protein